jgi:hypothetical protein
MSRPFAQRVRALRRAAALAAGIALTLGPVSASAYTTNTVATVGSWPNSHDGMSTAPAPVAAAASRQPNQRHRSHRKSTASSTNVGTVATVGGPSVTEPAPSAQALANTPSGCGSLSACMWDNTAYTGDLEVFTGTGQYNYFGNLGGSVCGTWNDCALSTYNSHTTCQVWWYTDANQQGSRLIDTPGSGSPNLYSTYEGDFARQLSSMINEYC